MAEAGGLQALYERNVDRGFQIITALNGTETADLAAWADEYGLTHPVVGDAGDEFFWTFSKSSAWPMIVLLDRGMLITSVDDGAGEAEVEELLAQYE
jgi:hypothetical protein